MGRYAALTQLASSRNPAHVSWVRDLAWELRRESCQPARQIPRKARDDASVVETEPLPTEG